MRPHCAPCAKAEGDPQRFICIVGEPSSVNPSDASDSVNDKQPHVILSRKQINYLRLLEQNRSKPSESDFTRNIKYPRVRCYFLGSPALSGVSSMGFGWSLWKGSELKEVSVTSVSASISQDLCGLNLLISVSPYPESTVREKVGVD